MNVTFNLATILVLGLALVVGYLVHRGTAPATGTMNTTTKGDRLVSAVAAAAGVVVIGTFVLNGVQVAEPSGGPAPNPAASRAR